MDLVRVENLETHVDNLQTKVENLKAEMSAAIAEIVGLKSAEIIKAILAQFNLTGNEAVLSWKFEEEYDDEGGTVWYPYNLALTIDGEEIDLEENIASRKSKWSNSFYEDTLDEALRDDFLYDLKEQLYADGVEKITVNIREEN